jgi:hypothetical protein
MKDSIDELLLVQSLIEEQICYSNLKLEQMYYDSSVNGWVADILPDGLLFLGHTLKDAFDICFDICLSSERCSNCEMFTTLKDSNNIPTCGICIDVSCSLDTDY